MAYVALLFMLYIITKTIYKDSTDNKYRICMKISTNQICGVILGVDFLVCMCVCRM